MRPEEGEEGAAQSPLTPVGHTREQGWGTDAVAACPGWGKSQHGPFCVGLAGNGSETLGGSGFGKRGFVGGTREGEHIFSLCSCSCVCVCVHV